MPEEYVSKYNTLLRRLVEIGVDPKLITVSHIIDSVSHSKNELDFDTASIVPGPFGELVKINYSDNQIEIYTIEGVFYSEKVIDLETGELIYEKIDTTNFLEDLNYYGGYLFDYLIDNEEKDYSNERRIRFNNHTKCEIKKQEIKNDLIRQELPKLKEGISPNLSDYYAHIGVRKILNQIDKAYSFRDNYKIFESTKLSPDMLWVINNKLRLDFLKKEEEKFDCITMFPIVDLIEEYLDFDPNNKKAITSCNRVIGNINNKLNNFHRVKTEISRNNSYLPVEEKYAKLNMKLFLRRARKLNKEEE